MAKKYEHHDMKTKELPGMPEKDAVGLAVDEYRLAADSLGRAKDDVEGAKGRLLIAMKQADRPLVIIGGIRFEITKGEEKLKVSKI